VSRTTSPVRTVATAGFTSRGDRIRHHRQRSVVLACPARAVTVARPGRTAPRIAGARHGDDTGLV
jgi:hypothetical protein